MAAVKEGGRSRYTIKTIWGVAKDPLVSLDSEELHMLVYRETGAESIARLTGEQIDTVCRVLFAMKDSAAKGQRRTDTGGNPKTVKMRRKIYMLTKELGWNGDNKRINGFCKRMCKVDRLEWLSVSQCSVIIEGLKKIIERQGAMVDEEEKAAYTE